MKKLAIGFLAFLAIGVIGYFIWPYIVPKPQVPIGFTIIDKNGDARNLTDDVRITYTSGMMAVQNKAHPDTQAVQMYGVYWFYRTYMNYPTTIKVVHGHDVLQTISGVVGVSNTPFNSNSQADSPSVGTVFVRLKDGTQTTLTTDASTYIVINE